MPLRLLFVGNYLVGASRPVTLDLAERLGVGHQIILTSHRSARLPRLLDMLLTAVRRRREYEVAVVDVYSRHAFIYAEAVCAALRTIGKPYVLTLHGGNLPAFGRRWPGRVRRLLASAAAVTAPSAYLVEQMRCYRSDLMLVPNGLEIADYRFRYRTSARPRLLWLRAFHRLYNPALAPAALASLAADFPEIQLTMVGPDKGDGSLEESRQVAVRLGVTDRVELPGLVNKADVPQWLDAADVFVNTADIDNAPVSVLEAMAAGLCVVSTRVGGLPYLLEHEQDALLVPPRDPLAMAQAVRRILEEPSLAARLSANARKKAERFDWGAVVPEWIRLLHAVSRKGSP